MLVEELLVYFKMNPEAIVHPHPPDSKRLSKIKLPNLLRVDPKDTANAHEIHKIKLFYFDKLADIMVEHFSQLERQKPQ